MAQFSIDGRMTVKTLVEKFKEEYNLVLRVYNGRLRADENATLASLRVGDAAAKTGNMIVAKTWKVDTFEKKMLDEFGIKVQVYTQDGWVAVLDGISLETAGTIKKNAVKADMLPLVGK